MKARNTEGVPRRAGQMPRKDGSYALPGRQAGEDPEEFRACRRKLRFATEADAKKAAARGARRKDAPQLFVYRCPWCAGWHLTHRRPR